MTDLSPAAVAAFDFAVLAPPPAPPFEPPPANLGRFELTYRFGTWWWARKAKPNRKQGGDDGADDNPDPSNVGLHLTASAYQVIEGYQLLQREGKPKGLIVEVLTEEGTVEEIQVTAEDIANQRGARAVSKLKAAGMRFAPAGADMVRSHLMMVQPRARVLADRPGWFEGGFLLPNGEALLTTKRIGLSVESRLIGLAQNGEADKALEGLHKLFEGDNGTMCAAALAALSGPLIDLGGTDGCSYLLEGTSSTGKSASQEVAASFWGPPKLNDGLFVGGDATKTGLEAPLERASGTVFCLDEDKRAAEQTEALIFAIQQGGGRLRGTVTGGSQRQRRYKTVGLISAEVGFAQRLAAESRATTGGLTVRALAIPTDLNPEEENATAQSLEWTESTVAAFDLLRENYGHIGRRFIGAMDAQGYVADPGQFAREVAEEVAKLEGTENDRMKRRAGRMIGQLAVVASILKRADMIPNEYGSEVLLTRLWRGHLGGDLAPVSPVERAIESLSSALVSRQGIDVSNMNSGDGRTTRPTVAFKTFVSGKEVYAVEAKNLVHLAGGVASDRALRKGLRDGGYLLEPPARPDGKNPIAWSSIAGLARTQYIVIRADRIEGDAANKEAPASAAPLPAPVPAPALVIDLAKRARQIGRRY